MSGSSPDGTSIANTNALDLLILSNTEEYGSLMPPLTPVPITPSRITSAACISLSKVEPRAAFSSFSSFVCTDSFRRY